MAEISNGLNSLIAQYGTDKAKAASGVDTQTATEKASIGDQDVFMTLYIEQLKNQDPTAPQDTNDMVAQMSQFNQVEQLSTISSRLESMSAALTSSQALGASTLVGKSVFVSQKSAELAEDGNIALRVEIPDDAQTTTLKISDASGNLVKEVDLSDKEYTWDGKAADGNPLPPGSYQFSAKARTFDGDVVELQTLLPARIQGVTINGANGTELNVAGHGKLSLSSELEIVG
ncbi:flagellar biosynthesis protein FlgD [Marinomonas sp. 15G1-11]|uniref:Basal-body rod modification protein FlgD n=1 Tax=Marinomonas phaeophyticola TaxID=3004091 RepID=A0ABT4JS63_9GAMM|nr:flagellar hook capping FlgD N-terminal domain-containing protein [Marinomonas sp. 15G1-11]MCZ2721192.1 flagellar biosynthesis protein FlgD [Marinomonas sp. 15G1-11]